MPTARRTALRKRYLSLGLGELTSAAVFIIGSLYAIQPHLTTDEPPLVWAALTPLVAILVQAGGYWIAARSWVIIGTMPGPLATLYRVWRVLNIILLAASLVIILAWNPTRVPVRILAIGIWLFAVIEYVNYYVRRLAYPARHWLARITEHQTPRLIHDLRSVSSRPTESEQPDT